MSMLFNSTQRNVLFYASIAVRQSKSKTHSEYEMRCSNKELTTVK